MVGKHRTCSTAITLVLWPRNMCSIASEYTEQATRNVCYVRTTSFKNPITQPYGALKECCARGSEANGGVTETFGGPTMWDTHTQTHTHTRHTHTHPRFNNPPTRDKTFDMTQDQINAPRQKLRTHTRTHTYTHVY